MFDMTLTEIPKLRGSLIKERAKYKGDKPRFERFNIIINLIDGYRDSMLDEQPDEPPAISAEGHPDFTPGIGPNGQPWEVHGGEWVRVEAKHRERIKKQLAMTLGELSALLPRN